MSDNELPRDGETLTLTIENVRAEEAYLLEMLCATFDSEEGATLSDLIREGAKAYWSEELVDEILQGAKKPDFLPDLSI